MKVFKWLAIVLVFVVILLGVSFYLQLRPVGSDDTKAEYRVLEGMSSSTVAKELADKNLIKSSLAFRIYIKASGGKLQAGIYELSPAMSGGEIGNLMIWGKYLTGKITIPEGWRITQIANLLKEDKFTYASDFEAKASGYEGYLFPDTYQIKKDATSDEIIKKMRDNYDKKVAGLRVNPEIIILASIVEREAQNDEERTGIAGVYANRLKIGMKLEADPTVQYAKGDWKAPTVADYHGVVSPYNTYLNEGMPPGPICNPGIASIRAALSPASHDYIFFFHAGGKIYYSKTHDEHRARVNQYF